MEGGGATKDSGDEGKQGIGFWVEKVSTSQAGTSAVRVMVVSIPVSYSKHWHEMDCLAQTVITITLRQSHLSRLLPWIAPYPCMFNVLGTLAETTRYGFKETIYLIPNQRKEVCPRKLPKYPTARFIFSMQSLIARILVARGSLTSDLRV
jgi:hypothetical protein